MKKGVDEIKMNALKDVGGHKFCRQLATRTCQKANIMKNSVVVVHEEKLPIYQVRLGGQKTPQSITACCPQRAIFHAVDGYLKQRKKL